MRLASLTCTAAALVVILSAGAARAQPCGSYEDVVLGTARVTEVVRSIGDDLARGDDSGEAAPARVAAYRRALDRIEEVDRAFGLCDRADPAEEALARTVGLELRSPVTLRRSVAARCVALVRRAHLPGDDAARCLAASDDVGATRARTLAPIEAPPRWTSASDPSAEHAAMRRELRARPRDAALRLDLARVELASADFAHARRTIGSLGGYDALLVRALASYALEPSFRGEVRLVESLRSLAAEEPRRVEAQLALARIARAHGPVRPDEGLERALVVACVLDPPRQPELRDEVAMMIAWAWEALGRGRPWAWDGAAPAPTLPLPRERLGATLPDGVERMPVAEDCSAVLARAAGGT